MKQSKQSFNKWVTLKDCFYFLLSLMGPRGLLPVWSPVNGAGSRTHEQLSGDLTPSALRWSWLRGSVYQPSSCRGRFEPSEKSTSVYDYSTVQSLRRCWREEGQRSARGCCRPPAVSSQRGPQQLRLSGEVQKAVQAVSMVGLGGGGGHMAV